MTDRWQWVDAFREANIPTAVLMNMPEDDFKKYSRFLIDAGIAPVNYLNTVEDKDPEQEELDKIIEESKRIKEKNDKSQFSDYRYNPKGICESIYDVNSSPKRNEENEVKKQSDIPKAYVWDEDNVEESNKMLSKLQESQYKEFEAEQLKKQAEEEKIRIEKLKQNYNDQISQSNRMDIKRENIEKYENLPPEPEDGKPMAILLPDNTRIARKCNVFDDAKDIFTIVEGQKMMYEKDDSMKKFKIIFGINNEMKRDIPLNEQGINGRTLFKVLEE
ncbi:hypothetical protein TVAG_152380 [Trichomonas vaginalis G3]|uniref:UBX domain-containing protein n=1 Tax=Trichomonas vaginalis (strain ATCC PRA-98 / G3) TaxID=412133 RepID=A2F714_TRIV3|nr:hypothetical protein TVAG_152380 [Trichomonas vaginalis G3]|eukprot:XP_001312249.1 hypothetical protein [Trichomonas vaginalis G3]